MDGDALLSKIPHQIWNDLGVDPTQAATSVTAGRIRRLISHGKVLVTQFQTSGRAPAGTPNAGILCPPSWQEHAPPRLTPESVAALSAMFTKNFPGELLIAEALPSTRLLSIRLLSIIHHQLQPTSTRSDFALCAVAAQVVPKAVPGDDGSKNASALGGHLG